MIVVNLEFPTGCLKVTTVLKRSACDSDITYDLVSGNKHADVSSEIPVKCDVEFVVQETGVKTEVKGTDLFPKSCQR